MLGGAQRRLVSRHILVHHLCISSIELYEMNSASKFQVSKARVTNLSLAYNRYVSDNFFRVASYYDKVL